MDERELEKWIKTIDTDVVPPEGLKEKMITNIMGMNEEANIFLNPFEKFIFEKPLFAAGSISVSISGLIWLIMGNGFSSMISGLIK